MNAERFLPWNLSNPAFIPDMADRSVDLLIYPENGGRRYTIASNRLIAMQHKKTTHGPARMMRGGETAR
jgi:hypothetical protein